MTLNKEGRFTADHIAAIQSPEGRELSAKVKAATAAGRPVTMTEAEVNLFVQIVVETQRRDLAEIQRLREALEEIVQWQHSLDKAVTTKAEQIARAALERSS